MKTPLFKIGYVVALLAVCAFALFSLRGPQGIPAWLDKRQEVHAWQDRNTGLAREIEAIRSRIKGLEEDRIQQEWEIRKRLKLVHPNEKVFILQDSPSAAAPAPAAQ